MFATNPLVNVLKTVLIAALLFVTSTAFALDLQQAKAQGLLGETASGYLEPVTANAEATALANSINAQRKAEYQRIATKNNIAISDVEALAGKKAIEKTPAGQYVKVGGNWQKK
jgi:uncharacterized protein YdbL (DUF1318 family)